jgi:D-glycero-alpha-D-manno-heptose-7-phosphate kinase
MPRSVSAAAPTRIDLAGGTVDLWPLYLLHERPLTVNAAITLTANATVETSPEPGIELNSIDRGVSCRLPPASSRSDDPAQVPEELTFIVRLARHFLPGEGSARAGHERGTGVRITTRCMAPAGSGLGGSSTLGIALATALDRFTSRGYDAERLLFVTKAIETQVLGIPTGEQDYHPALRGGVLGLHYTVEGTRVERLAVDPVALRRRTVLVFTGLSRNSGISNWDIFKRHLDGDREVRGALQAVSDAAQELRRALLEGAWDAAGNALAAEWAARRRLSPAVTDTRIDRLIEEACSSGAIAGKVCGAGGGGCIVFWVREGAGEAVSSRMAALGATVLEFEYIDKGVTVTES